MTGVAFPRMVVVTSWRRCQDFCDQQPHYKLNDSGSPRQNRLSEKFSGSWAEIGDEQGQYCHKSQLLSDFG